MQKKRIQDKGENGPQDSPAVRNASKVPVSHHGFNISPRTGSTPMGSESPPDTTLQSVHSNT